MINWIFTMNDKHIKVKTNVTEFIIHVCSIFNRFVVDSCQYSVVSCIQF